MVVASKIISIAIAVVVAIMVGVVIATSLGTQDDVPEATEPESIHAPSETSDTVNETSVTLVEPQGSTSQITESPISPAQSEEFETVDIGIMFPSDDAPTSHGHDNSVAVRLGAADFNAYLDEVRASWRINLVFADAQSNPATPLEKIQSLNSKGVKFVLGPKSDAEIHSIKSYAHSNEMILISPSSTSPSLAIDDNIFRLAPDTARQGKVLALLFEQEGIEAVIPVYRSDAWGFSLYESARNNFEILDRVMDVGTPYPANLNPEYFLDKERIFELALLSDLVEKYTARYPADKVAVLLIGFSETAYLLDRAGSFDNLHDVRWFGSDSLSGDDVFSDHPAASAFAQDVDFVSVRFATPTNDVYEHVLDYFADFEDVTPDASAFASYDSVWVLGKAVLDAGSVDPLAVRDAITDVASAHTGAIGTVNLDEFGDFATPDYDLWGMSEGAWHKSGHFDADNGTFDFASDSAMDGNMTRSDLPKVVDVGMMITNLGAQTYNEELNMAHLGMSDFNSYLEEIGAPWRMNLVLEDIGFDDTMKTIKSLDSNGVKFVLGHIPSADIHHIKSYVDSNDMVLISSWSSSPSLAVVDNIFRFSPDVNREGNVLSLLFEREGIEAVIPIHRGDVWGDGIYESTRNSFEALGGVMDDGVRYSPESTAYSAEASMLSDLVDKYTSQYPADKVAVLVIGFHETVHLLDSADSFDNLDSVRWFGPAILLNSPSLSDEPRASVFLQDVDYVGTGFGASRNDVYADVQEYFEPFPAVNIIYTRVPKNFDSFLAPDPYSFSIYDSIWVLGKTILETDSIDPLTVRDAITDVASRHTGATGTINLNEFGDFATPSYNLWSIRDGQWYLFGHFDADSDTFSFT